MRVSKETREEIKEMLLTNPEVDKEQAKAILAAREPRPDASVLIDREYAKTIDRIAARSFDDDGIRTVFALRGQKTSTLLNLDLSDSAPKINVVKSGLLIRRKGLDKSINKALRRVEELEAVQ